MRRNEIKIGGFYTKENGAFAREVLGDDGMNIIYRDYGLLDGKPISTRSQCLHSSFSSWADRECTPAEKARCNVAAMEQETERRSGEYRGMLDIPVKYAMFEVLDAIKTEYIVAYLEVKGYEVTRRD